MSTSSGWPLCMPKLRNAPSSVCGGIAKFVISPAAQLANPPSDRAAAPLSQRSTDFEWPFFIPSPPSNLLVLASACAEFDAVLCSRGDARELVDFDDAHEAFDVAGAEHAEH